ncbi:MULTISPECIES: polymorphic toxin-type HINT domain-containing protein [unclassified Saccharothrix]|uniref:polymorphic toxin-type HINT domain-containing protein n=1 Tax=unclassified Saccharothrix TaxID=2593673 RepID=UPI00307EAD5E
MSERAPGKTRALVLVAVAAVVVGLIVWVAWPSKPRDRAPFEQAVAALAGADGVRYTDTTTAGLGKRDVTTTRYGHQFGTVVWQGSSKEVLSVDGVFYAKGDDRGLPQDGKWRTGHPTDHQVFTDGLDDFSSPFDLAERLAAALDDLPDLPSPTDDLPPTTANGVDALRAETAVGSLFVAKHAPYRVLRLEPRGLLSLPPSQLLSLTALPSPQAPVIADSDGVDLTPIVEDALVGRMYDTLAEKTRELTDAVDGSFRFDVVDKDGDVVCGLTGCTATSSFTGKLDPRSPTVRVAQGLVTVTMSAAFTVNGRPAGRCTTPPASFPVVGDTVSGQVSCSAPEGGAIIADLKSRAEAQARATGRSVPYNWVGRSQVEVTALASARTEVDDLLNRQRRERAPADCPTPNSFVPGTPVLLADGSVRPIEQVTPGTLVRATDPATGRTTAEPVLAHITGTGPKHVVRLDTADGSVTATTDHPFWAPERGGWVPAGALREGDALASTRGPVAVLGGHPYERIGTVHNLTIAGPHTYYVQAGATSVLVHNCGHTIGFAPGEGVKALTDRRLQHGTKNLIKAGVLPKWQGKTSPELFRSKLTPILERPDKTVDHELGGTRVKGFLGEIDGRKVAVFVFKEGPYAGELASSSVPSPNQLKKWGL